MNVLLGSMSADDGADALAQHYRHTAAQLAAEAEDLAFSAIAAPCPLTPTTWVTTPLPSLHLSRAGFRI